jgi:hypothetical protein
MNAIVLSLDWLQIFFIVTTIVSLIFNIIQWRDKRSFINPITNNLVSLFNDIKAKTVHTTFVYNALFNPNSPHKDIHTLRWEYGLFVQDVAGAYQGFQESVVGLLISLNPKDKEGKVAFRAAEYGLTKDEKEAREMMKRKWREQSEQGSSRLKSQME